jgi:uncharacterized protein YgbK (DUF1537 family)
VGAIAAAAAALRAGRPVVLTTRVPLTLPVGHDEAHRTALALAATGQRLLVEAPAATVVVLGGDTAAAVLGAEPIAVGGTVAPGTPWARRPDGGLVVTRAGGFGTPAALLDLLEARLVP